MQILSKNENKIDIRDQTHHTHVLSKFFQLYKNEQNVAPY